MASVSVNKGMPGPEESAIQLPRDRWRLLAMARRRWAEIDLPHDCRLLQTVVDEAPLLAEELGLGSGDQFLTEYLSLDLDLVGRVLGWLEQEQPAEAVPLALADKATQAQPLADHRRPTTKEAANKGSDTTFKDRGQAYLLRRLARDAPEVLDRVKSGEIKSARAAAIEAGIIKPVPVVRLVDDMEKVAANLRRHLSQAQAIALATALTS